MVAVMSHPSDFGLIGHRQTRLFVVQYEMDATHEIVAVSFNQMPHHLVDTPLAGGRMPGEHFARQGAQKGAQHGWGILQ
jgi:hypothetical protein